MHTLILLIGCTVLNLGEPFSQEVAPISQAGSEEKQTLAKAALVAYAANIHAFSYYKCVFRTTAGKAKSIEDAIQGRFLNARLFDSRLVVEGAKDLFQGRAHPDDKRPPHDSSTDGCLRDGKLGLCYVPFIRSANLYSTDNPSNHIIPSESPLGMGMVGHRNAHGPDIKLAAPDKFRLSETRLEEVEGRPVVTIRLDYLPVTQTAKGPIRESYQYSLDRGRGYLPIRMSLEHNGVPVRQAYVTHVQECSNKRWIPERTVLVFPPSESGELHWVKEIKILELDADKRPQTDDFKLILPAGTNVLDNRNPAKHFRLKQQETITPDDLPKLFKILEEVQRQPRADTGIPRSNWDSWARWGGMAGGLTLALGGVAVLVRRRWRMA